MENSKSEKQLKGKQKKRKLVKGKAAQLKTGTGESY